MPKKVLIVEDNPDIRGALKVLVEMEGYDTIAAANGPEACAMAAEELPDLILMDLSLPGMDGIEAARLIHEQPENADLPIVCVSSYAALYRDRIVEGGYVAEYTKTQLVENLGGILKNHTKRMRSA